MKLVKCVSPHGGCHNGMYHNGQPVFPLWDAGDEAKGIPGGFKLPEVPPEKLRLPANPGGYVEDARIPGRFAAVGQVYTVDDSFQADGFHWEDAGPAPAPAAGTATPTPPPEQPTRQDDTPPPEGD